MELLPIFILPMTFIIIAVSLVALVGLTLVSLVLKNTVDNAEFISDIEE
jgi:hypothetical protein